MDGLFGVAKMVHFFFGHGLLLCFSWVKGPSQTQLRVQSSREVYDNSMGWSYILGYGSISIVDDGGIGLMVICARNAAVR